MNRLDHDLVWPTASALLGLVGHRLRDEERLDFFKEAVDAMEAILIRRDELLARERKRLGKPLENRP